MSVIIIGGGAAGLMAIATLLEQKPNTSVTLIERNDELGKKIIISGGGRCNVTTGLLDVKIVLSKYPRGGKFLSSAMHKFPPGAVMEWFENHGVPVKIQPDLRVFPKSDNGHDVVKAFTNIFKKNHANIMLKEQVIKVETKDKGFAVYLKGQATPLLAKKLVLTTGGQAYRHTGSTGDGYAFALSLGHSLTPLAPSLNALYTKETWPANVSGLAFAHAKLSAKTQGNPNFTGPFIFTHRGVSGPAIFALSSLVAFENYDLTKPLHINIDLFPDQSIENLNRSLVENILTNAKKSLENILAFLIPKSLAEVLCSELKLQPDKHAAEISKKELAVAVAWLKSVPLQAVAKGTGEEFVTAGGVKLSEVNSSTMESRLCPGLYFAGEILNIDGFTGGFNLQSAWTTGHLAGEHIAHTSS
ncbi:MAG: NAD(P)/FAD-dependent oxidoreductase [Patescibacteria group bacterium]